jgi:MFS family permease
MTGALAVAALAVAAVAGARGTWSPCGLSMVSAINPLSERARGNRYWLTAGWFGLGSVLGGVALGSAGGLLAVMLRSLADHRTAALWIAAAACLVALAADRRLAGFGLPLHPRQVNELWLTQYRRWLYAAGFGVQIGIGFATYIMTAATYLTVVLAALTGSPALAVATGAVFGLVRGLAVLLSARCRSAQALRQLHLLLNRLEPASLRAAMTAEALVAAGLGYAAAGVVAGAGTLLVAAGMLLAGDPRLAARRARSERPSQYVTAD